jgi:hypothetical protein
MSQNAQIRGISQGSAQIAHQGFFEKVAVAAFEANLAIANQECFFHGNYERAWKRRF